MREPLQRHLVAAVVLAAGDLEELVAGQHQLRDHGHQVLEGVDVDADRLHLRDGPRLAGLGLGLAGLRSGGACELVRLGRRLEFAQARRLAEGALELLERDLAGLERPLGRGAVRLARAEPVERADEVAVDALRLGGVALELGQDVLDAVERREDQRHGLGRDGHAVAELAHQRLGRMGERLEPRQPEEAAGALDGVDEPEDVAQDLVVVGIALEADELDVDDVEMLPVSTRNSRKRSSIGPARRHATHKCCDRSFAGMGL